MTAETQKWVLDAVYYQVLAGESIGQSIQLACESLRNYQYL